MYKLFGDDSVFHQWDNDRVQKNMASVMRRSLCVKFYLLVQSMRKERMENLIRFNYLNYIVTIMIIYRNRLT